MCELCDSKFADSICHDCGSRVCETCLGDHECEEGLDDDDDEEEEEEKEEEPPKAGPSLRWH